MNPWRARILRTTTIAACALVFSLVAIALRAQSAPLSKAEQAIKYQHGSPQE